MHEEFCELLLRVNREIDKVLSFVDKLQRRFRLSDK